jgi:hypothetical protein
LNRVILLLEKITGVIPGANSDSCFNVVLLQYSFHTLPREAKTHQYAQRKRFESLTKRTFCPNARFGRGRIHRAIITRRSPPVHQPAEPPNTHHDAPQTHHLFQAFPLPQYTSGVIDTRAGTVVAGDLGSSNEAGKSLVLPNNKRHLMGGKGKGKGKGKGGSGYGRS